MQEEVNLDLRYSTLHVPKKGLSSEHAPERLALSPSDILCLMRVIWYTCSLGIYPFDWLVYTNNTIYGRGVKLIFTGGHISLTVAFKGPK